MFSICVSIARIALKALVHKVRQGWVYWREPWNYLVWRSPCRVQLSHVPKRHIHRAVRSLQGRDSLPALAAWPTGNCFGWNFQGSSLFAAEEGGKLVAPFPLHAAAGKRIFCLEGIECFFSLMRYYKGSRGVWARLPESPVCLC